MAGYFLVWSSSVLRQPKVEITAAQKLYVLQKVVLLHLITFLQNAKEY